MKQTDGWTGTTKLIIDFWKFCERA